MNIKKLLLSAILASLLIACSSSSGPIDYVGGGSSDGGNEITPPPVDGGEYANITQSAIDKAKTNETIGIIIGDREITLDFDWSNGNREVGHHTALDQDNRRNEVVSVVGQHTFVGLIRTQTEDSLGSMIEEYEPWKVWGGNAVDRIDNMKLSGTATYKGEAIGVGSSDIPQSGVGRGAVTANVNFDSRTLEGNVIGTHLDPNAKPFGPNDQINFTGNITGDKWTGSAWAEGAGASGSGESGGYFLGKDAIEMNGYYKTETDQSGAFVGSKQ